MINGHPQNTVVPSCGDMRQVNMQAASLFHNGLLRQCEEIIAAHGHDRESMKAFENLLSLLMFSIEMERDRVRRLAADDD